jgi:integrative and conjugative element protein (TIGR02256 family)
MPSPTPKVWLADSAAHLMRKEASRRLPLETGGILLGYWSEDGASVAVTDATEPGPNAIHRRDEFIPDDEYQNLKIDEIYEASGRVHRYLGDWHTHPFGGSALSYKDRRNLHRIATTKGAHTPIPLMAVLSGGAQDWNVSVWSYERPTAVIDRLALRCSRECIVALHS